MTTKFLEITEGLWLQEEFLTAPEMAPLTAFLTTMDKLEPDEEWMPSCFAFRRLVLGSETVLTRFESACGNPIWDGTGPATGAPIPGELRPLVRRVDSAVKAMAGHVEFTSLYVDWYDREGSFVSHVDRDCYGPLVAGVSIGEGAATLRFSDDDSHVDARLRPGSLYLFGPPLRYEPWTHEVFDVTGRRFAVTLRTGACR